MGDSGTSSREVASPIPCEQLDETCSAELDTAVRGSSRKLLAVLLIAAAAYLLMQLTPLGQHIRNLDELTDELVRTGGVTSRIYFIAITAGLLILGIPRLVLFTLGGFLFDFWEGLAWSMLGSLIGSFTAFRLARWAGREWLIRHFGKQRIFCRIVDAKPTVASVALMRLLPVSNLVMNIGLALSKAGNKAFLFGSLIGFLPQGVVAVVIGDGIGEDSPWTGAVQIATAGILLLAALLWASNQRKRRP